MKRISILFLCTLIAACSSETEQKEKTDEASKIQFEPTYESLSQHPLPTWFDDAKLGIFIHWGLYSVPGWAQGTKEPLEEILAHSQGEDWFANNPYAEWYYNSLRIEGSSTEAHHLATYGEDFSYFDFADAFNEEIKKWDPKSWAKTFKDAGAGYVVLTTKHHDGFLLWPGETQNPFKENYFASRDLVGELSDAVKQDGMKMGLYYSSGLDWTFNEQPIINFPTLFTAVPQTEDYAEYIDQHWRELIRRYEPAILWADIGSPQAFDEKPLIADYYNEFPKGVVNNRHKFSLPGTENEQETWYDFTTPEYQILDSIAEKKWETCRGIGLSFGYNQLEDAETFLSIDELVDSFVDIVSKNGNLLLNIGPRADGSIPKGQLERLQGLGNWMGIFGEAINGTRAWEKASAETSEGGRVRFTQKSDALYVLLLDEPKAEKVEILDLDLSGKSATWMDGGEDVKIEKSTEGTIMHLPKNRNTQVAYGIKVQ